jgi:hypothetical protein
VRYLLSTAVLAVFASASLAAPPSFNPPDQIPIVSGVAVYMPPADCVSVKYIGLDGEEEFPLDLIGGSKTGFAFIARGLPAGKTYRFVGVASSATGEQVEKLFTVVIPDGVVVPPPKKPPVVDPPAPPPAGLFFMIVREDGGASPAFTKIMENPAWETIRAKGHVFKDYPLKEARDRFNATIPPGGPLPMVITLRVDGKVSRVVRPAIPLSADPLKLLEGLP